MKAINRVKNSVRENPVAKEILLSQFAQIFESLPGKALKGKNTPVNVFGILLKSPKIASIFVPYWAQSKQLLQLSVREQELIILKSACYFGCDYVWGHHVVIALEAGVSQSEIDAIPFPPQEKSWNAKEKALLLSVEALLKTANLSDELWKELKQHYKTEQILDIITVVSQYVLFNAVNNVFGVKLENSDMPSLPDV